MYSYNVFLKFFSKIYQISNQTCGPLCTQTSQITVKPFKPRSLCDVGEFFKDHLIKHDYLLNCISLKQIIKVSLKLFKQFQTFNYWNLLFIDSEFVLLQWETNNLHGAKMGPSTLVMKQNGNITVKNYQYSQTYTREPLLGSLGQVGIL